MAAVELIELVPALSAQVSSPGANSYGDVSDGEWIQYLLNGFYSAQLDGLLGGWEADEDGEVSHTSNPSLSIDRMSQQIVVIYAAIDIIRNEFRSLKTVFKAKAGPVQYETQQHATVLRGILDSLMDQKERILDNLVDSGGITNYVIDGILARDSSLNTLLTTWVDY